jgi:hypothetical protein
MVGAGALAGTIAGSHTNATGAPPGIASDNEPVVTTPLVRSVRTERIRENSPQQSASATSPAAAPSPSAAAVVALRFPSQWRTAAATAPAAATDAGSALAFAAPQRSAPAAPTNGYQLASVDPAPMPKRVERPAQPKNPVLFNDAQLTSIKERLKLTPQQAQHWPQVEQALRAISWRLATTQDTRRPVRGQQASMIDPSSPEVARLKSAAFPLIMSMREDQKREVRQLAHTMGLSNVAAMF